MNITRNENQSNERDCEDIQFQIKEICTTNQYLITYIDSVKKERVEYPKQNTLNFENITKIIVEIDSITAQRGKKWERGRLSRISLDPSQWKRGK